MKTNVELNSPQEEDKSKQKEKDKNSINKNEENNNNCNINNININENEEKNKEDKNINKINENGEDNNYNNNNDIDENKNVDNIENSHKQDNINEIIKNEIEEEKNEEDPLITYITSNRKISEEEIKNASKLILEEIDGTLLNGKIIEINAGGMIDGRNKKDGFTIFGQKKCENSNTTNSNPEIQLHKDINNIINNNDNNNDIFTPDIEINYSKFLSYPYIFAIYYKREDKNYYIRAYSGKGSDNKILFIKLNNEEKYVLKQKELISAGNIIFQVHVIDAHLEIINLTNKKHSNCKRNFNGFKKNIVTIGRHKDCDFFFPKDKSFSRYQTTFEFDENKKEWSVIDGKDNKGSTNGTWIFGTHSFLIKNEMIVEILNSKIQIKEIKNENLEVNK